MGQGYSLTTLSAGSATIDVPELADLIYEKSLGNARFMKCIRARHKNGLVIAKVVMKPSANKNWDAYIEQLTGKTYGQLLWSVSLTHLDERTQLADIPNALPNHRILQTSTSGYLVRQYVQSSLYDRMRWDVVNLPPKTLILICFIVTDHSWTISKRNGLPFNFSRLSVIATLVISIMEISKRKTSLSHPGTGCI